MKYENNVILSLDEYLSMRDRTIKADRLADDLLNACDSEKFLLLGDVLNVLEKYVDNKERIEKIRKEHA